MADDVFDICVEVGRGFVVSRECDLGQIYTMGVFGDICGFDIIMQW